MTIWIGATYLNADYLFAFVAAHLLYSVSTAWGGWAVAPLAMLQASFEKPLSQRISNHEMFRERQIRESWNLSISIVQVHSQTKNHKTFPRNVTDTRATESSFMHIFKLMLIHNLLALHFLDARWYPGWNISIRLLLVSWSFSMFFHIFPGFAPFGILEIEKEHPDTI